MEIQVEKKTLEVVPQQDVPDSSHQIITIEDVLDEDKPKNDNTVTDEDIKRIVEQVVKDSTLCENLVLMQIDGSQSLVPSIPTILVVSMSFVGNHVVEVEKVEGDFVFSSLPTL